MNAIVDIDDVIFDWTDGFDKWVRRYKNYTGVPITSRPDHIGTLFYEGIYAEFNSSVDFESLNTIEGAKEALEEISKKYDIILVSSCGLDFLKPRKINLEAHLPNLSYQLKLLNLHENKDYYINFYNPTLYIDDNMHNVTYSAEQGCINTYIFHTEFNKSFNHPKVKRAYTWRQILKEI